MTKSCPETEKAFQRFVRAIVLGKEDLPNSDLEALLRLVDEENMGPLLSFHGPRSNVWPRVPDSIKRELARVRHYSALYQLRRRDELRVVLDLLDRRGIRPVLYKGFAHAHLIYPSPELRPSEDIDLMIDRSHQETVREVMEARGYKTPNAITGDLIVQQRPYYRREEGSGIFHALDFHWKLFNPQMVANLFDFEELSASAVTAPALHPHARAASPLHSLVISCVHRVAHHHHGSPLLWLLDIHKLYEALPDRTAFVRLALDKRVAAVCLDGLSKARIEFGTELDLEITDALALEARSGANSLLREDRRLLHRILDDLRHLDTVGAKLSLLANHAFPPAEYMYRRYSVAPARTRYLMLPFLYLRRIVGGICHRLFRRC